MVTSILAELSQYKLPNRKRPLRDDERRSIEERISGIFTFINSEDTQPGSTRAKAKVELEQELAASDAHVRPYQTLLRVSGPVRLLLRKMDACGLSAKFKRMRDPMDLGTFEGIISATEAFMNTIPGEENNLSLAAHDVLMLAYKFERLGYAFPTNAERQWLRFSSLVTDIGKPAFPDEIISDNRYTTASKGTPIRAHTEIGYAVLQCLFRFPQEGMLRAMTLAPLLHHERLDGTGYPYQLRDGQIPFAIRLLQPPDAFYAMTLRDGIRGKRTPQGAMDELRACVGTQFDSSVVEAYVPMLQARAERSAVAR